MFARAEDKRKSPERIAREIRKWSKLRLLDTAAYADTVAKKKGNRQKRKAETVDELKSEVRKGKRRIHKLQLQTTRMRLQVVVALTLVFVVVIMFTYVTYTHMLCACAH